MGLIPRDEKFFPMFNDVARILCESADLVAQLFADPSRLDEIATKVKALEHRADGITHDVITRIDRSFVTPLDREDIHLLTSRLDDVIDLLDGTVRRAQMFHLTAAPVHAARLADVLKRAASQIETAVRNMKKPKMMLDHTRTLKARGGGRRHLRRGRGRAVLGTPRPAGGDQVDGAVRQARRRDRPVRQRVERAGKHRPEERVGPPWSPTSS